MRPARLRSRLWSWLLSLHMPDDRDCMSIRMTRRLTVRFPLRSSLILALVCATASGCNRPAPQASATAAPPAISPVAPVAPAEPREPKPYETPRPAIAREATPLPDLREAAPGEPTPKAGRQVQRCTNRGRITYVDLNAPCAEGPGERVTVFPTRGVEASR